jgi:glycosyltransferase involved in cell wall biosynthesis
VIVVVAPYAPVGRAAPPNLGASRKLETLVKVMSKVDHHVVLVNSAHNGHEPSPMTIHPSTICNVEITEVTPELSGKRRIGKLRNIWGVSKLVRTVLDLGTPSMYWFYNAYAFEMRFAFAVRSSRRVPRVLEFEDWHFSRRRGLNPKPLIDYFFWQRAMSARAITHAFVANSDLEAHLRDYVQMTSLLPGVVPDDLAWVASHETPFNRCQPGLRIGFFGGLSAEKGADLVLRLVPKLTEGDVLVVSGSGPLRDAFYASSRQWPDRLEFHMAVDQAALYRLIAGTDVILNPHVAIETMKNGVFPFKAIEAIASGRVVVSTEVPARGLEGLMRGVLFVPRSDEAFLKAIRDSARFYAERSDLIAACATAANARFGEAAIMRSIEAILQTFEIRG